MRLGAYLFEHCLDILVGLRGGAGSGASLGDVGEDFIIGENR